MRKVDSFDVPETPEEVFEFVGMNFIKVSGIEHDEKGNIINVTEDTTVVLTLHDLLSAFDWWTLE